MDTHAPALNADRAIAAARALAPPHRPPPLPDAAQRLAALGAQVARDLAVLDYPRQDWVIPRTHPSGAHVWDVVVVGAGQGGLATWFGLWREKVRNVLVVDQAPRGREGPWVTYSRMWTLRSPKHLTGPDLGIPSLTPQYWYQARFGDAAWEALAKWPRDIWQDYLDWYRAVLAAPVRNEWRLDRIAPDAGGVLRLEGSTGAGLARHDILFARKVVLANGIEGGGDWRCPDFVRALPRDRWDMCTDDVDSARLAGARVAVLGAGATAWDRAADVLEHGAASLTLTMRRRELLAVNPFRWMEKAGYLRHYASMDDAARWRWMTTTFDFGQPPTQDGLNRCARYANFRLHGGATWTDARATPQGIELTLSDGTRQLADHLLVGTGFDVDPALRPELRGLAPHILLWRDRFQPPAAQRHDVCAGYPYLAPDLSFMERTPGACPALADIHCFNYAASVSNGFSGASLSGMKYGIEPMLWGITRSFWLADEGAHYAVLAAWDAPDTDVSVIASNRAA